MLSGRAAVEDDAQAQPIDEAAFQISYRRAAPGLRSYIRRICGDIALADDIFQESQVWTKRRPSPALRNLASMIAGLLTNGGRPCADSTTVADRGEWSSLTANQEERASTLVGPTLDFRKTGRYSATGFPQN